MSFAIIKDRVRMLSAASLLLILVGCGSGGPGSEREVPAPPSIPQVKVEVRADGLAYVPHTHELFSGEAVSAFFGMPWLMEHREAYRHGLRHGEKVEYYKDGTKKTVFRHRMGVPESAVSFYPDGVKQMEQVMDLESNTGGTYATWHPDGTPECNASVNKDGHWNGDYKEFTPDGTLRTHYFFRHGVLRQVNLEDEAGKQKRAAAGMVIVLAPAPAGNTLPVPGSGGGAQAGPSGQPGTVRPPDPRK